MMATAGAAAAKPSPPSGGKRARGPHGRVVAGPTPTYHSLSWFVSPPSLSIRASHHHHPRKAPFSISRNVKGGAAAAALGQHLKKPPKSLGSSPFLLLPSRGGGPGGWVRKNKKKAL